MLPPKPRDTRMTNSPIWYIIDPDRGRNAYNQLLGIAFNEDEANSMIRRLQDDHEAGPNTYHYCGSGHRSPSWMRVYAMRPEAT